MKRISFSWERCWTVLNFQKTVKALQISSSANRQSLNKLKMLLTKRSESRSLIAKFRSTCLFAFKANSEVFRSHVFSQPSWLLFSSFTAGFQLV